MDTHVDKLLNAQKVLEEQGSIDGTIHRFLLMEKPMWSFGFPWKKHKVHETACSCRSFGSDAVLLRQLRIGLRQAGFTITSMREKEEEVVTHFLFCL